MYTLLAMYIDLEVSEGDFYGECNQVVSCCPYTSSEGEDFSCHMKQGDRCKEKLPEHRKLINIGGGSDTSPVPWASSTLWCFPNTTLPIVGQGLYSPALSQLECPPQSP